MFKDLGVQPSLVFEKPHNFYCTIQTPVHTYLCNFTLKYSLQLYFEIKLPAFLFSFSWFTLPFLV
jgi:hypothetical protein